MSFCLLVNVRRNSNNDIFLTQLSTDKECLLDNLRKVDISDSKVIKCNYQDIEDIVNLVSETKLNETTDQFHIAGYPQPYRRDRNRYGGGVMFFVREDLPSKQLHKHVFTDDIEALIIEINLRKTKFIF